MDDAKTILRKGIELWNAHDREAFLARYDEAFKYEDMATGQQLLGREGFGTGFYDLWLEAYPDNQIVEPVIFGEGDLYCLQARFVGTNTGTFHSPEFEMPPTGKKVDSPFAFVIQFKDGKAISAWHYYDRLLALEQEGMLTVEKLFAQLQPA